MVAEILFHFPPFSFSFSLFTCHFSLSSFPFPLSDFTFHSSLFTLHFENLKRDFRHRSAGVGEFISGRSDDFRDLKKHDENEGLNHDIVSWFRCLFSNGFLLFCDFVDGLPGPARIPDLARFGAPIFFPAEAGPAHG